MCKCHAFDASFLWSVLATLVDSLLHLSPDISDCGRSEAFKTCLSNLWKITSFSSLMVHRPVSLHQKKTIFYNIQHSWDRAYFPQSWWIIGYLFELEIRSEKQNHIQMAEKVRSSKHWQSLLFHRRNSQLCLLSRRCALKIHWADSNNPPRSQQFEIET